MDLGPILALAQKDLRLLLRNRGASFFAFGWPLVMAVLFGLVFGGGGKGGRIPVVVVDEDHSPAAAALVRRLSAEDGLAVEVAPRAEAEDRVRRGQSTAAVVIPAGYAEADARLFHGAPRRLEIAADPARKAEAAMLEGLLTGAAMQSLQELFSDPEKSLAAVDRALADLGPAAAEAGGDTRRFLGELRRFVTRSRAPGAGGAAGAGWTPLQVERRAVRAARAGPENAFEVTFPSGILWGVIGCALGFALSLVGERTRGTLARLESAPLSRTQVLLGKALACFTAIAAVEVLLLGLGRAFFGVRPTSWPLLAVAGFSVAVCFVGLMMVVAVLGKTEQSAGGLGWALMMPLTLLGGGMVPLFAMPSWMQAVGSVSPVKWGILALEGAIWRGFGPSQMLLPCGVLLGVGVLGFAAGARLFRGGSEG